MKSGLFTTEFWLALSPVVAALGAMMQDPPKTPSEAVMRFASVIALALTSFGYSSSRAKVKTTAMETHSDLRSR